MCETPCPQPGRPRRQDYEFRRGGTRNFFLARETLAGWHHMAITERRTMQDSPTTCSGWRTWPIPVVRVFLDNLNIHRMASLYETFPPPEVLRIAKRLEFRRTPKHAGCLNPVLSLPKGWLRLNSAR